MTAAAAAVNSTLERTLPVVQVHANLKQKPACVHASVFSLRTPAFSISPSVVLFRGNVGIQ